MPLRKIGQIELYYEIDGAGADTVAFVNGVAMTVQSWQPIRRLFVAEDFRCLLHDCRGQLRSEKPTEEPYTMELHAADLLSLLDTLGIERVHLVGTSYGSEIAMVFACTYPERVKTLTVIAGVSELDALLRAAIESWALAADYGAQPFFRTMLPWAYSSDYLARNHQLLRVQEEAMSNLPQEYFAAFKQLAAAFLNFDITADLRQIECPTLVMSAELDLIKGPRFGHLIHAHIPQSEFMVISGAGHAVVLERPGEVARLAIAFLKRHLDTGS